jgi:N-acetylneuraminic acid mutarotase
MKNAGVSLLIVLMLDMAVNAQDTWTQKASMYNYGRVSGIGCAVNGKGYVGLGETYGVNYENDLWEYDPGTNLWTRMADFSGGQRNGSVAYEVNGKMYIFFGLSPSLTSYNDVWEYNPATNQWLLKSYCPGLGRYNARGFVVGDSVIYIGTGTYNNGDDYLFDFWKYSPSTNTWEQKADFPGGKRMAAVSFALNDKGYFGTGLFDTYSPMSDFWSYDPLQDEWTHLNDFPSTRFGMVSFVIDSIAYVGTGDDYLNLFIDFWKYNTSEDIWEQIDSPPTQKRLCGVSFTIGNIGYLVTGWDKVNYFADLWAYSPDIPTNTMEHSANTSFSVYPNPVQNLLSVEITNPGKGTYISIYTLQGQVVFCQNVVVQKYEINLKDLSSGIYLIKFSNDSYYEIKKITKIN